MPTPTARAARAVRRRARRVYQSREAARIAWRARWVPAALGPLDIVMCTYAVWTMALIRSIDYGTGVSSSAAASLTAIEAAAPAWVWAAGFGVGGFVLGVGALARRHGLVWAGHSILTVMYTALVVGMAHAIITMWGGDGARYAGALILPAYIHAVLALRTGPRPILRGRPKATIVGSV